MLFGSYRYFSPVSMPEYQTEIDTEKENKIKRGFPPINDQFRDIRLNEERYTILHLILRSFYRGDSEKVRYSFKARDLYNYWIENDDWFTIECYISLCMLVNGEINNTYLGIAGQKVILAYHIIENIFMKYKGEKFIKRATIYAELLYNTDITLRKRFYMNDGHWSTELREK